MFIYHLFTISSVMLLQQIWNCSSLGLCCVEIWLAVIDINFVLHIFKTRLILIGHFAIASFPFNLHLRYKAESSLYCMQLLFDAILHILAVQRLKNIRPCIEPSGTQYLAVRKDDQFESICTKCCLCVR